MTIEKTARFVVEPDRIAEAAAAIEKFVAHARRKAVRAFTETLCPPCSETPGFEEWETVR